ncbi:MAG: Gfo/Idh/MocA family oxidoreductase [Armatimonadetes bacterium]|nr:Gfo/Idh/MocA family oxidoreductase [Armatimonadota bacterium]
MPQRVLICGFGSIGRRHFRHFRDLGCAPVEVYSTGLGTMKDDQLLRPAAVYTDLSTALAARPDVVVVANPTAFHLPVAMAAVDAGCNVLIEKPLSHQLDGCAELSTLVSRRGVVAGVAQNLRFHPHLQTVRGWVQSREPLGEALVARAHIGGYLPDWHPWEDYHVSYAARRDLGGGASLTNIHEIDYLLWILGPPSAWCGLALGRHPLGTDVDEAASFVLRHKGGAVSTATLSLAHKPQSRTLDLSFAGGTVMLDFPAGTLAVRRADGTVDMAPTPQGFTVDETYRAQAADFLNATNGAPSSVATLGEAIEALRIALSWRNDA